MPLGINGAQTNWNLSVSLGLAPGWEAFRAFGRDAISSASATYIASIGGAGPWAPATDAALEVLSASANDTAGGTGAQQIVVAGLDNAFSPITETVVLAGIAPVALTKRFIRMLRAWVVVSGAYRGSNIGNIAVRLAGGGASVGLIAAGYGQTQLSGYCVPRGYSLLVTDVHLTETATQPANFIFWQATNAFDVTAPYADGKRVVNEYDGIQNAIDFNYSECPIMFAEGTDVWLTGQTVASNGSASVEYCGFLVAN